MRINNVKQLLDQDYEGTIKELIEYELENGAILEDNLSINEVVEQFMASGFSTIFDLKHYFK